MCHSPNAGYPITPGHTISIKSRAISIHEFAYQTKLIAGAEQLVPAQDALFNGVVRGSFVGGVCYSLHGSFTIREGVGEAWMISDRDRLKKYPIAAHRSAREMLKESFCKLSLHRIQIDVPIDFHMKWCESLGFTLEGIMLSYTSDKKDKARYAMIR